MIKSPSNRIFIAGMGPGGLTSAIKAAQAGFEVVIAEPRFQMIRGQRVHIDGHTIKFLASLRDPKENLDDVFFNDKISHNGETTVEVKDIQRYLLRKLSLYPKIQSKLGYEVVGIDSQNQTVSIKADDKSETIEFAHCIAADGARHVVANLLNASLQNQKDKINFQPVEFQPRQSESGTIALEVKPGHQLPPRPKHANAFTVEHMSKLKKYGWDQPYYPKVYIFSNQKNTKLFVSGEIPRSIYNMSDKAAQRKALIAWGKLMVTLLLGYDKNDLSFTQKQSQNETGKTVAKNRLKITAFPLLLNYADKSCLKLGLGGFFCLVGDANRSANFFFSHGVNDAIMDACKVVESLNVPSKPEFNEKGYTQYQAKQFQHYKSRLKGESQPSDLNDILANFHNTMDDLMHLAQEVPLKEVQEQLKNIKTQHANIQDPADIENLFVQGKMLGATLEKYFKSKHKTLPLLLSNVATLFSKDYAKLQRTTSELNERLEKQFSRFLKFNPTQTKKSISQSFKALAGSISGSIIVKARNGCIVPL